MLSAAARMDESAMAVVTVIDHGIKPQVHPDVISVVDSELGRITISYTTGPDGTRWTSIWPTSPDALRHDLASLLNAAKAPVRRVSAVQQTSKNAPMNDCFAPRICASTGPDPQVRY